MRVDYLAPEQPPPPPALIPLDVAREVIQLIRSAPQDDEREIYILPEPGCARVADWCFGTMLRPPAGWIPLGKIYAIRGRYDLQRHLEQRIAEGLGRAAERRRPTVNWRSGLLDKRPRKDETFTFKEVADYLGTSRRTVNTLAGLGELEVMAPGARTRRVTRLSLTKYLERVTREARCGVFDRDRPPLCYLSSKRAAELLGVPTRFIGEQVSLGRLRCVSFLERRRFSSTELDAFVRASAKRYGARNTASEFWQPVRELLSDATPFAVGDPAEHQQAGELASTPAARPLQQDSCEALIARFIKTGEEQESDSFVWPGQTFAESGQRRRGVLANALVAEVERRAAEVALPPEPDVAAFSAAVRERIAPFVRGVVPPADQAVVLGHLVQAVELVTPASVGRVLRAAALSPAWGVANLYLDAIGARPLGPAPHGGVGWKGRVYVSLQFLRADTSTRFEDILIRECARAIHTLRRGDLGLRETYSKRWVLEVHHRNRELFARAIEVWSSISAAGRSSTCLELLDDLARQPPAEGKDEVVDHEELVRVLREAARERNPWKYIVEFCRNRGCVATPRDAAARR